MVCSRPGGRAGQLQNIAAAVKRAKLYIWEDSAPKVRIGDYGNGIRIDHVSESGKWHLKEFLQEKLQPFLRIPDARFMFYNPMQGHGLGSLSYTDYRKFILRRIISRIRQKVIPDYCTSKKQIIRYYPCLLYFIILDRKKPEFFIFFLIVEKSSRNWIYF